MLVLNIGSVRLSQRNYVSKQGIIFLFVLLHGPYKDLRVRCQSKIQVLRPILPLKILILILSILIKELCIKCHFQDRTRIIKNRAECKEWFTVATYNRNYVSPSFKKVANNVKLIWKYWYIFKYKFNLNWFQYTLFVMKIVPLIFKLTHKEIKLRITPKVSKQTKTLQ